MEEEAIAPELPADQRVGIKKSFGVKEQCQIT